MMAVKTKSGVGALIVMAAAAGVALLFQASTPKGNDESETITLHVTFDKREQDAVRVMYSVDGSHAGPVHVNESPWNRVLTVKKGARVLLTASQDNDGNLDCLISIAGAASFRTASHRPDAGSIRCYYPENWNAPK